MKKLFVLIFILCAGWVQSQTFLQKYSGIDFNIGGNISSVPFNGGINNARMQFIDIDGDGLKDLFAYDIDTTFNFYKNTGTASNPSFSLITQKYQNISLKNWFYFVNIDNDGDIDLFTGGESQAIRLYRNTGSATSPVFSLEIAQLKTFSDTVIISEGNCIPTFCDIDNDGDIDFFSGTSTAGRITFYENIGTPTNFSYKFITDFWQNIEFPAPALCPPFSNNTDGTRHGANAIEFSDIDNDNDQDLFFGELFSLGIYYIKNNGTPTSPSMAVVDSTYAGFLSLGFNQARSTDIDNDGDKDLFVSVLYGSQTIRNFVYFKNNGTPNTPSYTFITNNFMTNVDVSDWSNINFTDLDNDGKQDFLIAGETNGFGGSPKLSYYRNTGTLTAPAFSLTQDSIPLPITSFNFRYAPAFGDLDADGDKDIIMGSFITDSLFYYKNNGTPQNYSYVLQARGNQIGITGAGQYSSPTLVDIDNDGDLDLFLGDSNGRIHFYLNAGTPSAFNFVLQTHNYLNIDIGNQSIPRFYDMDSDGDKDLFIGRIDGKITFYKNDGNASSPNFVFQTDSYKDINVTLNSCPALVDIDNDTDGDIFVGNIKGGMYYYENRDVVGINNISGSVPERFNLYQNYPNPFNPSTNIKFDLPKSSFVTLKVYDTSGKLVSQLLSEQLNAGIYEYSFNAPNLSSGVYFYTVETEHSVQTNKMILLK